MFFNGWENLFRILIVGRGGDSSSLVGVKGPTDLGERDTRC